MNNNEMGTDDFDVILFENVLAVNCKLMNLTKSTPCTHNFYV